MEQEPVTPPSFVKNKLVRNLLVACGFLFAFLAFLGAILPLVPTTPFLLVASACFYRSSPRFYRMIMYNRYFGPYLRDYREGRGIEPRVKVVSLAFLWASTLVSAIFFIPYLWITILVICITIIVSIHILMIKTKHR